MDLDAVSKAKKKAFHQCYSEIQTGIENNVKQITNELYPNHIGPAVMKSNDLFMSEVANMLETGNSDIFDALVSALEKQPHLVHLAKCLKDKYDEILAESAAVYLPNGSHNLITKPQTDSYSVESHQPTEDRFQQDSSDHGAGKSVLAVSREPPIVSIEEHSRVKEEKKAIESNLRLQTQRTQTAESDLKLQTQRMEKIKKKCSSLRENVKSKNTKVQDSEKRLCDTVSQACDTEAKLLEYVKSKNTEVQDCQKRLCDTVSQAGDTEAKLLELEEEHDVCDVRRDLLQSEINKLRVNLAASLAGKGHLQEQVKELQRQLDCSEQEVEKVKQENYSAITQKEKELTSHKEELEEAQSTITWKDEELRQCKEEIDSLKNQLPNEDRIDSNQLHENLEALDIKDCNN